MDNMNSATQALLKTLANLESQEIQYEKQLAACEKELLAWKKDLEEILKAKEEIRLAISILEGKQNESTSNEPSSSKSKKVKSSSKDS